VHITHNHTNIHTQSPSSFSINVFIPACSVCMHSTKIDKHTRTHNGILSSRLPRNGEAHPQSVLGRKRTTWMPLPWVNARKGEFAWVFLCVCVYHASNLCAPITWEDLEQLLKCFMVSWVRDLAIQGVGLRAQFALFHCTARYSKEAFKYLRMRVFTHVVCVCIPVCIRSYLLKCTKCSRVNCLHVCASMSCLHVRGLSVCVRGFSYVCQHGPAKGQQGPKRSCCSLLCRRPETRP